MRFLFVEGNVILLRGVLDRVVLGIIGLDENFAGEFAASGASGNLREQLEGAFGGAKIRAAQREIGGDHADQRDALEIVAFGDHLRADQNVDFAVRECAEHLLVFALGADRVAIEARDARLREIVRGDIRRRARRRRPRNTCTRAWHFGHCFGGRIE